MSHCHKKYKHCRWHLTIKAHYGRFLSFIAFNYRTTCTFCLHWQSDVHLDHCEESPVDFSSLVTTTNFTIYYAFFALGRLKRRPYVSFLRRPKSTNYTQQANETTSIREHGIIWNIRFLELKETRPFCYFQHILAHSFTSNNRTVSLVPRPPTAKQVVHFRLRSRIWVRDYGTVYILVDVLVFQQVLYALHVLCIKITTAGSNKGVSIFPKIRKYVGTFTNLSCRSVQRRGRCGNLKH